MRFSIDENIYIDVLRLAYQNKLVFSDLFKIAVFVFNIEDFNSKPLSKIYSSKKHIPLSVSVSLNTYRKFHQIHSDLKNKSKSKTANIILTYLLNNIDQYKSLIDLLSFYKN